MFYFHFSPRKFGKVPIFVYTRSKCTCKNQPNIVLKRPCGDEKNDYFVMVPSALRQGKAGQEAVRET